MKVTLDTNCFIDAVSPLAHAHASMGMLLSAAKSGSISMTVSRLTLHELSCRADQAYELAKTFEVLPHWPIGSIGEQVAMVKDLAGTWDDAHRNQEIQREIQALAKAGNDIRDRGAYLDALCAGVRVFVTSDKHLAGNEPARKIGERFGLRVVTPNDLTLEFHQLFPAGPS
ncbi:MAG: hypothetical protein ACYDA9_02630 [Terriglobia bacterium]